MFKEEDELSLKWIVKRPTEVVGIEAKRQAVKAQAAKDFILAGMARDGHLAYRPSLSKGCLENPWQMNQEWTKGKKMGSHRMKRIGSVEK